MSKNFGSTCLVAPYQNTKGWMFMASCYPRGVQTTKIAYEIRNLKPQNQNLDSVNVKILHNKIKLLLTGGGREENITLTMNYSTSCPGKVWHRVYSQISELTSELKIQNSIRFKILTKICQALYKIRKFCTPCCYPCILQNIKFGSKACVLC